MFLFILDGILPLTYPEYKILICLLSTIKSVQIHSIVLQVPIYYHPFLMLICKFLKLDLPK